MSVDSVQSTSGIERVSPTSTTLTAPNPSNNQAESLRSTPANEAWNYLSPRLL